MSPQITLPACASRPRARRTAAAASGWPFLPLSLLLRSLHFPPLSRPSIQGCANGSPALPVPAAVQSTGRTGALPGAGRPGAFSTGSRLCRGKFRRPSRPRCCLCALRSRSALPTGRCPASSGGMEKGYWTLTLFLGSATGVGHVELRCCLQAFRSDLLFCTVKPGARPSEHLFLFVL